MPASDAHVLTISLVRRRVVFGALTVLALIVAVSFTGCARGDRKAPQATVPAKQPDKKGANEPDSTLKVEFGKARVLWNDEKGHRVWEAQFKEAVASQTGQAAELELHGVRATLYRNGEVASTLIAPKIIADSRTREIRATGGVKVVSAKDGAYTTSDQLLWKARQDRLVGTGGVKLRNGNVSIRAASFTADTALKKVRFAEAEVGME